jgi:hypothetical protein
MASSVYHSILRISAVITALVLVFVSGLLSPVTALLADQTEYYLANAVGVSVGVAPTELNQMTAALTVREQELEARALALSEREIALDIAAGTNAAFDTDTFVLATILFILLVLIILNYALDYVRAAERQRVMLGSQQSAGLVCSLLARA